MRIMQLILTDYLLFKDSAIHELTVDFSEQVQLIVGSNGSGKSALLRQLSPVPSSRSMFGKDGYRCLVIEHDGIYYKLESEYQKSSSPHLFTIGEDTTNLNLGRTTETQRELLLEHLRITPFVDDLIMNRFTFPKWTPAKRKEFLMANNPDDIGFVLQLAKQTTSKLRAIRNTITHLLSRKIILEQDLIEGDTIAQLEEEKRLIEQTLSHFQQHLMDLQVGLKTVGSVSQPAGQYNPNQVKDTLKGIRYALVKLAHIPRDDELRREQKEQLSQRLEAYRQRIETIDHTLAAQTQELGELEARYRELAPEGNGAELDETILALEAQRDRLRIPQPEFLIEEAAVKGLYGSWEILNEKLMIFEGCPVPLYSRKKREARERQFRNAQYRQSSYLMRLSDLRQQYDEVSKRRTISPTDIPDAPCAKNACPLFAHFMEGYESAETKRQWLRTQIEGTERKQQRLELFLSRASEYFETSKVYHNQIEWLIGEAQSNPILHKVLRSVDVLSTLQSTPNRITNRLKEAYEHLTQWWNFQRVISDLETAYALKQRLIGSQDHDTVKLVVSIESLKKALSGLQDEVLRLLAAKHRHQKRLDEILTFDGLKHNALRLHEIHQSHLQFLTNRHEHELLTFLKSKVEHTRNDQFVRMGEIDRILRSQGSLQERYQEEVVGQLDKLNQEREDLEQIEKALIAIPKENTIDFVNEIFTQANRLIAAVWTLPLEIELLKHDDGLSYEFSIGGDNETSREMSECSEGQTEIITLAINLALRIQLGHLGLPLCLDEVGRTFDETHKRNLVFMLKRLLDDGIISQLFLVSHTAVIHEAFSASETLVLREDNVTLPEKSNLHVTIR